MKKIISGILAVVMAAGLLAGCGGNGKSGDYKSQYDFEKQDPVIELTTDRYIESEDGKSDWANDPYIKWCETNLGIRWVPKFVVASKQEHDQKLVLLAATNDLPDVVCDAPAYLVKEWYKGGFLRILEDDINQWGSDLTKYIINDEYKKQSNNTGFAGYTTEDGKYYALPMVLDATSGAWSKFFYRADVLNELGMNAPTSIKELEDVFSAYVERHPGQAALLLDDYFFTTAMPLFQIFGSYASMFYEKDGKIVYGSLSNETKDVVATLREWYKKGYISKSFSTLKYQTEMDKLAQGEYFMVAGEQWFPKWIAPKLNEKKSDAKFMPLGNIKDKKGNTNKYYSSFFIQYPAVVSKNCKYPEAVIKEMNVLYESGMRNEKDLREKGFSFRWPETPVQQPVNLDEVAQKGIKFGKYDYPKELTGPYFLNQGPTTTVSICRGNGDSRAVSSKAIDYKMVLETLQSKAYDMQATLSALPPENRSWFNTTFVSNPEAKGNPWGCEATLKNKIAIDEAVASKNATTDGGWSVAYTGPAYDDYFIALQDLERKFFTEIITGERPLDDFDLFVSTWKENGGNDILAEKNAMYNSMKNK